MTKKAKNQRIAVYWDFENIHASLMDRLNGEGAYRRCRGRQPELVTFAPIMAYAASLGEVVVRKAYADWNRLSSYKLAVLDASLEPVLLFTRPGGKNSADMRLVADVMEDLARYPAITQVIILSGDGDFVPLAQKLRLTGRQVIGVGVQGSTSSYSRKACNIFRDYEAITGNAVPSPTTASCKSNGRANGALAVSTAKPAPRIRSQPPASPGHVTTTSVGDASVESVKVTAIGQGTPQNPMTAGPANGPPPAKTIRASVNGKPPSTAAPASLCEQYRMALKKRGFRTLDFAILVRTAHSLSKILADHHRHIATLSELDSHLARMLAEQAKPPSSQTIRWARSTLAQGPGFGGSRGAKGVMLPDQFNAEARLTGIALLIVRDLRRAGHWPIERATLTKVLGNDSRSFIETAISRQNQPAPEPKPNVALKLRHRKSRRGVVVISKPKPTLVGRLGTWLQSLWDHTIRPDAATTCRKA